MKSLMEYISFSKFLNNFLIISSVARKKKLVEGVEAFFFMAYLYYIMVFDLSYKTKHAE